MPVYEFTCPTCSSHDLTFAMAEVPNVVECPTCGEPAIRRMSAPGLSHAGTPAMRLIDATANSAHAPQVVQSARPGSRTGPGTRVTANPLHRTLPRP